jgi:hypothetical protein
LNVVHGKAGTGIGTADQQFQVALIHPSARRHGGGIRLVLMVG